VCLWAQCEKDLSLCQVIRHSTMGSYVTWLHALSWLCQHGSDGTGAEGRAPWVPQSLPWTRVWDHDTLLAPKSRWASQLQHSPRAVGILLASKWQAKKLLKVSADVWWYFIHDTNIIFDIINCMRFIWPTPIFRWYAGNILTDFNGLFYEFHLSGTLVAMFGIEPRAFLLLLLLYFPCSLLYCEMGSNTKETKIKLLFINIK